MSKQAWIDESELHAHVTEPLYLMGAVTISDLDELEVSSKLKPMASQRSGKLHWRELRTDKERDLVLSAVLDILTEHDAEIVVVSRSLRNKKYESARHDCVRSLLWSLENELDFPAEQVIFESRSAKNDASEKQYIIALRRSRYISQSLRCFHVQGAQDSRLWLPDIVLGAFNWKRQNRATRSQTLQDNIDQMYQMSRLVKTK